MSVIHAENNNTRVSSFFGRLAQENNYPWLKANQTVEVWTHATAEKGRVWY